MLLVYTPLYDCITYTEQARFVNRYNAKLLF